MVMSIYNYFLFTLLVDLHLGDFFEWTNKHLISYVTKNLYSWCTRGAVAGCLLNAAACLPPLLIHEC